MRRGAEVLARFTGPVGSDRSFTYEWRTCAGNDSDPALKALLAGWSLADQASTAPLDNRQAKLRLAGLGVAFGAERCASASPMHASIPAARRWRGSGYTFTSTPGAVAIPNATARMRRRTARQPRRWTRPSPNCAMR